MKRRFELRLGETISTGKFSGIRVDWGGFVEFDDEEIKAMNLTPADVKEAFINDVRAEFFKRRKQELDDHFSLDLGEYHEKQDY